MIPFKYEALREGEEGDAALVCRVEAAGVLLLAAEVVPFNGGNYEQQQPTQSTPSTIVYQWTATTKGRQATKETKMTEEEKKKKTKKKESRKERRTSERNR